MKGLFLNNVYSSIGNMKIFLFLVLAMAAAVIVTGNPTAQELFVYITITALSANAVVSSRKDAVSRWNKYEIALPIRRKEIIQCKYLAYLFWVAVGTTIALAITFLTMLLYRNSNLLSGMDNFYSMFALGIGISLLTGAFFYPILYLAGTDKSETMLIISVLMAVVSAISVLSVLNQFIASFFVRMAAFILFYLIVFFLSYCLTLYIYSKKEF